MIDSTRRAVVRMYKDGDSVRHIARYWCLSTGDVITVLRLAGVYKR